MASSRCWRSLYDHHAEVGRSVAPVRDFADTWRRRRAQYEGWLAGGDGEIESLRQG